MDTQRSLTTRIHALGWTAFLGLVISTVFPGLTGVNNIAGALGVLVLLAALMVGELPQAPSRGMRWVLLLFCLGVVASTIIPNLEYVPDTRPLRQSLHDLWNTAKAVTAGWLGFLLLRQRRGLAAFVCLWVLTMFVVTFGELITPVLRDIPIGRLIGTKGGATRYAIFLMAGALPLCGAAMWSDLREIDIPAWARYVGMAFALTHPFLLTHKRLVYAPRPFDAPALMLAVALLILMASLLWSAMMRYGSCRRWIAGATLVLLFINLGLTGSRGAMLGAAVFVGGMGALQLRPRTVLVLILPVCVVGLGLIFHSRSVALSRRGLDRDLGTRVFIWKGGLRIFQQHAVLGAGYGTEAFRRAWPFRPPYPTSIGTPHWPPDHAHNLWIHLLATRGAVGWITFHALWAVAGLLLWRTARPSLRWQRRQQAADDRMPVTSARFALVSFVGLFAVQALGLFMLPLREHNEIAFWGVLSLGFAVAAMGSWREEGGALGCPRPTSRRKGGRSPGLICMLATSACVLAAASSAGIATHLYIRETLHREWARIDSAACFRGMSRAEALHDSATYTKFSGEMKRLAWIVRTSRTHKPVIFGMISILSLAGAFAFLAAVRRERPGAGSTDESQVH